MKFETGRELTTREREVLIAMIEHAVMSDGRKGMSDAERAECLTLIDGMRAWGKCTCGCPSIDLGDAEAEYPSVRGNGGILEGYCDGFGLMLFFSGGRPTSLEQYRLDSEEPSPEFPPLDEIFFGVGDPVEPKK